MLVGSVDAQQQGETMHARNLAEVEHERQIVPVSKGARLRWSGGERQERRSVWRYTMRRGVHDFASFCLCLPWKLMRANVHELGVGGRRPSVST
jgi:hypothetical protein